MPDCNFCSSIGMTVPCSNLWFLSLYLSRHLFEVHIEKKSANYQIKLKNETLRCPVLPSTTSGASRCLTRLCRLTSCYIWKPSSPLSNTINSKCSTETGPTSERREKRKKQSSLNYQREPCAAEITWERFIIDFVSIPSHPQPCSPALFCFSPLFFFLSEKNEKCKKKNCPSSYLRTST